MDDQHDSATDQVLRTILANTNDVQGGTISQQTLYLHCVAHADMSTDEVEQALAELVESGKIQIDNGECRPAPGVERPKYRGEK